MKKYIIVSISILIIFGACNTSKYIIHKKEKLLIGNWNFINVQSPKTKMNQELYEATMKELLKNSYMNFYADKSALSEFTGKKLKGTWKIVSKGEKLIIKFDGKDVELKIITLTKTDLVYSMSDKKDEIIMTLKKE